MKFETYEGSLQDLHADVLVLILDAQNELFEVDDEALQERLAGAKSQFSAGKLARELSFAPKDLSVDTVLVYHSDLEKNYGFWENIKTFAARGIRFGAETARPRVAFALNSADGQEHVGKVVEGILLGSYTFEKYRQKPRKLFDDSVAVIWTRSAEKAAFSSSGSVWWHSKPRHCRSSKRSGSVVTVTQPSFWSMPPLSVWAWPAHIWRRWGGR